MEWIQLKRRIDLERQAQDSNGRVYGSSFHWKRKGSAIVSHGPLYILVLVYRQRGVCVIRLMLAG